MHQDPSLTGSHLTKKSFLDKYNSISKTIKSNASCYAISTEWWVLFESLLSANPSGLDLPMENPGPINNLPLLKLSEIYRELVHINEETGYPSSVDGQVLAEMSDWDNMTLKPNLKYRTDFVIISVFLWKFLQERFQGGPEIELLPEQRLEDHFFRGITPEEEPALDKNVVVNVDMIKVYVTKDQEFDSAAARYISPTITVQSLLNCLCKDFYLPPHKAALHHKINETKVIELKDKKATLLSQNIHEGSFLSISRGVETLLGFPATTRNQESMWDREERIENSTDNEDEERRQQLTQDSDFEGNYSTHSRNSTDSARLSTGSTNPHLNPLDFSEYMFGDEIPGTNNQNNRDFIDLKDFGFDGMNSHGKQDIPDLKDQSYPTLELFLKRSRQSTEKQKIKYELKSLQEIKANLIQIQREWNLCTKSNLNKKA